MARGWESKSIEAQQEEREARANRRDRPEVDDAERARILEREALQLARSRLTSQLSLATREERRQSLEAALADLDRRLDVLRAVRSQTADTSEPT